MPLYSYPNILEADSIINHSLACSVAANALTIALKDQAGNDPSSGSPVKVNFRSATLTSGVVSTVYASSALSTVISSGSTAGHESTIECPIYVGLLNNAGTIELCWSTTPWNENELVTTTAEGGAGAADSATVVYSTTARTGVASRIIGKLLSTQTTAGTWAAVPTNIQIGSASKVRGFLPPTVQRFTSGSGTYTLPVAPRKPVYIVVEMVGGGGGGGGSGTTSGTAANDGVDTTFGTSLLTAGKGLKGARLVAGGVGGAATVNSPAISLVAVSGGSGTGAGAYPITPGVATTAIGGGCGGNSAYGGAGGGASYNTVTFEAGQSATTNSGSGGGGATPTLVASAGTGSGGGAGAFIRAMIVNPSATYAYAVGGGGSGQLAGTSGAAGGAGGSGMIIVTEYYQ